MKKKLLICVFAFALFSASIFGCGKTNGTGDGTTPIVSEEEQSKVVMTIGDMDVTVKDVCLYSLLYFSNVGLSAYENTESGNQAVLDAVCEEIKMEYVEYQLALVTEGVEPSLEDRQNVEKNTDAFMQRFGDQNLSVYGITRDDVNAMFNRQIYIMALTGKAVSDFAEDYYEEFQEKYEGVNYHTVTYALFPGIAYGADGNPVMGEDGSAVTLSEEELAQQKEKADALCERAKNGESLEDLIEEYDISAYSSDYSGFDGEHTAELNAAIDALEEGGISDVIESAAGYMVFRLDQKNDENYKDYVLQYASMQAAQNMIPVIQQSWLQGSGEKDKTPEEEVLRLVDIADIAARVKSVYEGIN